MSLLPGRVALVRHTCYTEKYFMVLDTTVAPV